MGQARRLAGTTDGPRLVPDRKHAEVVLQFEDPPGATERLRERPAPGSRRASAIFTVWGRSKFGLIRIPLKLIAFDEF